MVLLFPEAMEAKLVSNNVQGPVVFPSYQVDTLSSSIWIKSKKQYIALPKELFNREGSLSSNGKMSNFTVPIFSLFLI